MSSLKILKNIEEYLRGRRDDEDRKKLVDLFLCENNTIENYNALIRTNITTNKDIAINVSKCICDFNKDTRTQINNKYIPIFESMDYMTLKPRQWDDLRIISICFGMLNISHVFRSKCKERVLKTKGFDCLYARYMCLLENNELDKAEELLSSNLLKPFLNRRTILRYKNYLDALYNRKCINDSYSCYLYNKRFLLIGPGANEKKIFDYNVNNDVVARINYLGINSIPKINRDIKTNISYYNSHTGNNLNKYNNSFIEDLDYCCGKSDFSESYKKRKMNGIGRIIPFGSTMMIQRILIDLLFYNFDNVYITNVNLYASKKRYSKEYLTSENDKKDLIAFAWHDIEGNFIFTKNYYNNNYFKCDEELLKILSMSANDYMNALETVFN